MLLKSFILLEYYYYKIISGAREEILSFTFLLFLWDNASRKLKIASHFAKCELLIRTLCLCQPFLFLHS